MLSAKPQWGSQCNAGLHQVLMETGISHSKHFSLQKWEMLRCNISEKWRWKKPNMQHFKWSCSRCPAPGFPSRPEAVLRSALQADKWVPNLSIFQWFPKTPLSIFGSLPLICISATGELFSTTHDDDTQMKTATKNPWYVQNTTENTSNKTAWELHVESTHQWTTERQAEVRDDVYSRSSTAGAFWLAVTPWLLQFGPLYVLYVRLDHLGSDTLYFQNSNET